MFRGVQTGSVDDKGRLKLSASVKRLLKDRYKQADLFVTSLDGKTVKVFPIREWEAVEERLSDRSPSPEQARTNQTKGKILFQANRYGAEESLDGQGRVLVPSALRESAELKGAAVRIQWQSNHMVVMTEANYNAVASRNELTDDDWAHAAELGL